jgi:hypothetical protein
MSGHINSAAEVEWNTAVYVLGAIREVIGGQIGLDPCSNSTSKVNPRKAYSLPERDGLVEPWDEQSVFVNAPFGYCYMHRASRAIIAAKTYREALTEKQRAEYRGSSIKDWVRRCADAAAEGREVFALLPAAVDTSHWHDFIFPRATAVCFFRGRVRYVRPNGQSGPAPMACALVNWGSNARRIDVAFKRYGHVWLLPHEVRLRGRVSL